MAAYTWFFETPELEVRCPRCEGRADADAPFDFHLARKIVRSTGDLPEVKSPGWHWQFVARDQHAALVHNSVPDLEHVPSHVWDSWVVVEKYPSIVSWSPPRAPSGMYDMRDHAVIKCSRCHFIGTHNITWPDDAYFQWDIRGHMLWAWSAGHARAILEFIASDHRDETRFPAYARSLRKLPVEFISARVRDIVVKRISETLNEIRAS